MAIYRYLALAANGVEVSGNVTAADAGVARKSLQGQGLRVLELESGENGNIASGSAGFLKSLVYTFRLGLSVRTGDLQMYYRQMQLMLRAGHTLIEALEASSRLAARPRLGKILERCAEKISAGSTFSAAMAAESKIFSRLTVKLTEAGEATGELDAVFERLAVLAERRADVRRQMVAALTYPAIVTLAAIGVVSFLVVTVIPRFAIFLESRGKAIPWAAQTMMDTADWLTRWGFLLAVGIIATIAGVLVARHLLRPFKLITDRLFLGVPVIGGTLMSAAMAQASWTFGLLLKSRLTVLDALGSVAQVTVNTALARAFDQAAENVLEGRPLAVSLDRDPIPDLLRHMAAIGERSGEMETVMETLGNHYQKDLDARVKFLSSMIEPVLTLLIGGVVGFVYFAFFQAVLTVSTGG